MAGMLGLLREFRASNATGLGVLVDPDHCDGQRMQQLVHQAQKGEIDVFLVGGSLMLSGNIEEVVRELKAQTSVPVIIFPGSPSQVSQAADALLLLSLVSGRNPELLIGRHVEAAPVLKASGLELISTAYMLIDGGLPTTVSYISNSLPIPRDKPGIAACTALASTQLGMTVCYLDAGSGAAQSVSPEMVRAVYDEVDVPIIVGGGIRKRDQAAAISQAGASLIVVGNALESEPELLQELSTGVRQGY